MIREIRLKNFKQHTDKTITFGEGLNVIRGDNGAGKTTALKGILYALFGASAVGSKDHLRTWGESGPMSVQLDIYVPGHGDITVTRGFNKATITPKGQDHILASGQTPVNKFLEDALGMSGKVLRNLLCAEQGKSQGLIDMGASSLQSQLEGVAKAEIIDQVLSLLSTDCSELNGEVKGIGQLADLVQLDKSVTDLEQIVAKRHSAYEATKQVFQDYSNSISEKQSDLETLLPTQKRRDQLISTRAQVTNALVGHKNRLASIEVSYFDPDVADQCIQNAEAEVSKLMNFIYQTGRDNAEYQANSQRLQAVTDKLNDLNNKKPTIDHLLKMAGEQESLHKDCEESEKELAKWQTVVKDSWCDSCGRAFDDNAAEHAKQMLKKADEDYAVKKRKLTLQDDQLIQELSHFNITLTSINNFYATLDQVTQDLANYQHLVEGKKFVDTEEQEKRVSVLNLEIADVKQQTIDYNQIQNEISELNNQISEYNELLLQVDSDLSSIPHDIDEQISNLSKLLKAERDLFYDKITVERNKCHEELVQAKSDLEAAKTTYQTESDKHTRHQQAINDLHGRTSLQKFLRKNRSTLIQDSWNALTQYASYLIESTTEGLMTNLTRAENGDFYIEEKGINVPVDELSGARKSIIGLCLRIALTKLFYGDNGFTLFDEVTADCTEENAARVAGLLQSLKSQVIMITHRESDTMNANVLIQL